MRVYTVHARLGEEPVLVREGFSWIALLFPTLWFLANGLWVVALLHFALVVVLGVALPAALLPWVLLGLQLLVGFQARDARRWWLGRRGYVLAAVVTAADEDAALARAAAERQDLFVTPWGQAA